MSVFDHYHQRFDAIATIRRHAAPDLKPTAGYATNFLGVRIDPKFFPQILADKAGTVEATPIPANWHADIAEWASALRAVDLAKETFTVVELGCGWGCWLNNSGVAARARGLDVRLVGVEGDPGHIQWARECCTTNGFLTRQVTLHHGIASGRTGTALFPKQGHAGSTWSLEAVFDATPAQVIKARKEGTHDELPMVSLNEIVPPLGKVDLLHIDIQGAEADLIAACLPTLKKHVSYILIGTHSRQIEGRLLDLLLKEGWELEIERPAIFLDYPQNLDFPNPFVKVDGVQGWRNPNLVAADA